MELLKGAPEVRDSMLARPLLSDFENKFQSQWRRKTTNIDVKDVLELFWLII
tara:strand:- start:124 stop:279 length:156 start_codon:yes stop_codon:yes gene_type:complete